MKFEIVIFLLHGYRGHGRSSWPAVPRIQPAYRQAYCQPYCQPYCQTYCQTYRPAYRPAKPA